ncbi:MAG: FmdB family transcriptional regulator [Planctomycetota bacterium]
MPTYVYEVVDDQGEGLGEYFEAVQPMREDALTAHPEDGRPVRRVPQAPNIAAKWSEMKAKSALSNDNLDRLGFTKYERKGEGYMERTAGKLGPQTLGGDD